MAFITEDNTRYGNRRKQQLTLVNKLRAIGAQADVDLPRIAVIGNQSAGKSSLVEAISGIQVPRDAGTCTRCPIECRLSSSEESWSCQVSIRWEYTQDGTRLNEVKEEPLGQRIGDKSHVELALRQAQHWVLNPEERVADILSLSLEGLRQAKENVLHFSRNVVCLDISGPGLTDFSFVDLPGIIQNAEGTLVHLVEDLVLSYIQGNCLILITIPMSDDIENQKAVRLAKQVDPTGDRTIGVLTKPDTLTAGAIKMRELWLDIIEGRKHPLKHGYYCVRQPDEDERVKNISATEARAAEEAFFSQNPPWSLSAHRHRFGTKHLIQSLGTLLSDVINESIPKLTEEVNTRLSDCAAQLSALPEPITTDPSIYVLTLITSFCAEVRSFTQGTSRTATLVQKDRKTYENYKRDIRSTAPCFLPIVDKTYHMFHIALLSSLYKNEEDGSTQSTAPAQEGTMYLNDVRNHIQRSLTRELPSNVPYSAKVVLMQNFQASWKALSEKCFETVHSTFRELLQSLTRDTFSRHPNLQTRLRHVIEELVKAKREATREQIAKTLSYETLPFTQNSHYLAETKTKYLSKYKEIRAVTSTKHALSAPHVGQQTIFGGSLFSPTAASPPTQGAPSASTSNGSAPSNGLPDNFSFNFSRAASTANQAPRANSTGSVGPNVSGQVPSSASRPALTEEERKREEANVLAGLVKLGHTGITTEDLGKLNPPDEYEEELELMAEVRAFFQVSCTRVIDYVPMIIDHEFLFAFAEALQAFLIEKLGLTGENASERCATYVAEDHRVAKIREEVLTRKKRLENVRDELLEFESVEILL